MATKIENQVAVPWNDTFVFDLKGVFQNLQVRIHEFGILMDKEIDRMLLPCSSFADEQSVNTSSQLIGVSV